MINTPCVDQCVFTSNIICVYLLVCFLLYWNCPKYEQKHCFISNILILIVEYSWVFYKSTQVFMSGEIVLWSKNNLNANGKPPLSLQIIKLVLFLMLFLLLHPDYKSRQQNIVLRINQAHKLHADTNSLGLKWDHKVVIQGNSVDWYIYISQSYFGSRSFGSSCIV